MDQEALDAARKAGMIRPWTCEVVGFLTMNQNALIEGIKPSEGEVVVSLVLAGLPTGLSPLIDGVHGLTLPRWVLVGQRVMVETSGGSNRAVLGGVEFNPYVGAIMTPEEKARMLGVPVIPKLKKPAVPPGANPTVAVCGECNIELKQTMGYVCPRSNCPCFGRISF